MSEYDELFNESEENLPKKLRKIIDEKDSALKEVQKELNELRSAQRQQTLSATLADKGINPKVAKFIPQDVEDIDSWIQENSDVFGLGQPASTEPVAPTQAEIRMHELGLDEGEAISVPGDLTARIQSVKTMDELKAVLGQVRA